MCLVLFHTGISPSGRLLFLAPPPPTSRIPGLIQPIFSLPLDFWLTSCTWLYSTGDYLSLEDFYPPPPPPNIEHPRANSSNYFKANGLLIDLMCLALLHTGNLPLEDFYSPAPTSSIPGPIQSIFFAAPGLFDWPYVLGFISQGNISLWKTYSPHRKILVQNSRKIDLTIKF